jgi:hypothetical protein
VQHRGVELTGPHEPYNGSCNLCRIGPNGEVPRRRVYELSLVMSNMRSTWRLCREHIIEVRRALKGTIA